ncbi:unnamed protein product [Adineta steineri]|uniref:F-box domain-containing protein n=1 Tax=Adineta steineri TaxID=433720 RepID=A0A820AV25_9BILA|nr:unnamed protein product [Adineta steineri]
MTSINVHILDLPDEILLTIFNKVSNIDLLYSLMGINEKLDRITSDSMFTKDVDLTTVSSNGTNDSKLDIVVDRFCTYIFPRIHNNVESLGIQASIFHRILHADYYPNLHKLTLLNAEMDMASHIFNEISIIEQIIDDTLLKLKCFSFYVNRSTLYFDYEVAPLLRRMSNLEKLTLSLSVRRRNSFIDGIYLTDEICSSIPHLHTFIFDIVSDDTRFYAHPKPSSNDIRQTFIERGYHADCYIDYYTDVITDRLGRCHVYSLPFTTEHIQYISSRFPGGVFRNVRVLRVVDTKRSFGKTFFAKISRSFPLLTRLTVSNAIEQVEKPSWRLKKFNETSSIITYPHLAELVLSDVHIDYVEQFLFSFNTCLPCLNSLHVQYEHLTTITENFTRDATRMNCAKVKRIVFNRVIHLGQSRNFYRYFPSLKKYCPM